MSTIVMSLCWPLQGMSPAQKAVLISLADNANDEGACWPSVARIAERTCLSERAVRNALRWLEQVEVLAAHQRTGRSTWYTVSPYNYNPGISCPPAPDAPPPRQEVPPTPAPDAGPPGISCPQNRNRTVREPSGSFASTPGDSKQSQVDQIVDLFNELLPELPRVVLVNKDRKSKVQARLAESPVHQDLDFWRDFFGMVQASDWLMGRVGGRDNKPFRCNFDWLIAPTNFVKVVEGNYNA
ncbi:helix-turn-helix domain-containing protein [Pseudomonas sp. SD17-1]|uniref:helix-turn-helix domain-containing protein n=1 Tax=Pseudomonas sp. SD17-1 TaxID=2976883 RepID=UPI0023DB0A8D|nr:helix-turn-helix domain-containing protein [Pseudomonas sp. SD17-1]WEJ19307.1 helix-turn-helix domain-containing protein [Pseudomonas sp. SD17-1]